MFADFKAWLGELPHRVKIVVPGNHEFLLEGDISLGGLIAAKLQEVERGDLDVICLNTPTWVDDVRLEHRMPNRLAFYSTNDPAIHERTADWPKFATASDLAWIDKHDTDPYRVLLAQLMFAYLDGDSVAPLSLKLRDTHEVRTHQNFPSQLTRRQ